MLIGCNGFKQSGKDTFFQRAAFLFGHEASDHITGGIPVERISYAEKLYLSAAAALGVSVAQLYAWKEDPDVVIQIVRKNAAVLDVLAPATVVILELNVREYLQNYGTEAHRKIFGDDFWVDHAMPDLDHRRKICVVTDCRFPNEAQRVRELGGKVVKIVGPPEVENSTDGHESEVPLPPELIDYYIDNSRREWAPTLGDAVKPDFSYLDVQILDLYAELRKYEYPLTRAADVGALGS